MRWTQRRSNRECASQPLAELIRDELDGEEHERLAAHLDECATCQQRLTVLAADSQWWLDAGRWLDPAAGGMESSDEDSVCDYIVDNDPQDSDLEQELLACGLLDASEKACVIGTLGRYEVHRVIGAGGTGIVLKAIDLELNRTVAIKVLSPALAASGAARRRFAREGQAVAAVAHENVVAVHHVEADGRLPFLVMQYIDGDSLQDLVARVGPLDVKTALRMTAQIASALSAAHDQGLVHRDVKPANILVGAAGQRVWITDFGLARAVDDASLTRTGFIAGTPHYMSPEQARGEVVRPSSDLFGLGSVLYFMLSGRPPFRAERTLAILNRICNEPHRPLREVNPDVPLAIAELVDRLLSKSVAERIANATTVRTYCLHLLAASTTPDGDLNLVELGYSRLAAADSLVESQDHRGRFRYGAWVVVTLLLIGSIGGYLSRNRQAAVDQTEPTEELAELDAEVLGTSSVNEPLAFADSVPADRKSEANAAEGAESSAVVAATAEMDAAVERNSTSQHAINEWFTEPRPDRSPPIGCDLSSMLPAPPSGQFSPPPVRAEPAQPFALQSQTKDVVEANEESSPWAVHLKGLRASVELFESQIEPQPEGRLPNSSCASPPVSDSFSEELHRLEYSLRMLESGAVPNR